MGIHKMNETIDYYNNHADEYFARTSQVEFGYVYERFLRYVPKGGRIMDLGCGSGRDVKWFCDHGYEAYGLDASEELVELARKEFGVDASVGLIEDWIAEEPFDGLWCCAALMHLDDESIARFFMNVKHNLKTIGALLLSTKSGIETGRDAQGRYFRDFNEQEIYKLAEKNGMSVEELWYTEDKLRRDSFRWMNVIAVFDD